MLSSPSTYTLATSVPINEAILGEIPFFSRKFMYSPRVFHSTLYLISPCPSCTCFFVFALRGPMLDSQKISVVTPCLISLCPLPSCIKDSSECPIIFIKPGATALPLASTSFFADAFDRSPMNAMVSAFIPISPL